SGSTSRRQRALDRRPSSTISTRCGTEGLRSSPALAGGYEGAAPAGGRHFVWFHITSTKGAGPTSVEHHFDEMRNRGTSQLARARWRGTRGGTGRWPAFRLVPHHIDKGRWADVRRAPFRRDAEPRDFGARPRSLARHEGGGGRQRVPLPRRPSARQS